MKNRKNRTVTIIADEIRNALKHEAADVFAIGALLAEAKKQVDHGEWLPWLRQEFSMSQRTAYRYLAVHELKPKLKVATVANFSTNALYWLADNITDLNSMQLKSILQAATKKWVGATEARAIASRWRLREDLPPSESLDGDPDEAPSSAPEESPPPPAPAPSPLDAYLINEFTTAIHMLMKLITKPSAKFVNTIATADLQTMANFLNGIAATQTKLKAEK